MIILDGIALGVGLSMDAMSVSLAFGAVGREKFSTSRILFSAFLFGFFQMFMPLAGWSGISFISNGFGMQCGGIVSALLLCGIGVKMLYDKSGDTIANTGILYLLVLAFVTSVDALIVGTSMAFAHEDLKTAAGKSLMIGVVTFLISCAGGFTGRFFGNIFGKRCMVIGGTVLILMGILAFAKSIC